MGSVTKPQGDIVMGARKYMNRAHPARRFDRCVEMPGSEHILAGQAGENSIQAQGLGSALIPYAAPVPGRTRTGQTGLLQCPFALLTRRKRAGYA